MTGPKTDLKSDPDKLRADIADTRNEMSNTIEELHGRLNPAVLKDRVLEQFHDTADTVKAELKTHFQDAKEAIRSELAEAKQNVRTELMDAKAAIKTEVLIEIEAAKAKVANEVAHAKAALREATVGKVEHMVDDAKNRVRGAGNSLVRTVRENPIPSALVGVGVAWLLMSRRRRASQQHRALPMGRDPQHQDASNARAAMSDATDAGGEDRAAGRGMLNSGAHRVGEVAQATARKVADAASGAASAVGHVAHDAGAAVSSLAHDAGTSISGGAQRVGHAAADLGRGAAHQARRVARGTEQLYDKNPLAVGAAVMAVGVAVGFMLPRTIVEDEWLGSASDQVADKAQELAHQAMGRVGDAADDLAERASASAHEG